MRTFLSCIITLFCCTGIFAQPENVQVLDKILCVVGDEIILMSEYEIQKAQFVANGLGGQAEAKCAVMESILFEKLLLHQARLDSVEVSEDMVQGELDRRISMFSQQLGSTEKLEEFYGKSIAEIRQEFYDAIEEQLMIQNVQQSITANIRVTPADVEEFYNNIPTDSLPFIDSEVEVSQIMIKPKASPEAIADVKARLEGYRNEVKTGEREFSTIALLYSEDEGTAANGGELGLMGRGQLVSEFEQVAYNLDEGEVSHVFQTEYGYHIMQMIERRGELFNARHILLRPKVTPGDLEDAKAKLIKIRELILTDSLSFAEAAKEYSDDEASRRNGGMILNPNTGSIRYTMKELDPAIFLIIDKMEIGDISEPSIMRSLTGEQAYRIVQLGYRSEAHVADLVEDYQILQDMTKASKTDEALSAWMKKHIGGAYIRLDDEVKDCDFQYDWSK